MKIITPDQLIEEVLGVDHHALDAHILEMESGTGILDRVDAFLARFVAYPAEHSRVAHTLWIAHTHLMESWYTTPRLAFMSAEKESGKTRALEVTELLVPDPIMSINISAAALIRKVDQGGVTILADEIDGIFGNALREEGNVDVRSILNGGYRRGAVVPRCVTRGKAIEVEDLEIFAPVALAGLRNLPDTLSSRSIIVRMRRRAPDESVESFRLRKIKPQADVIKRMLAGWCESIDVADAEPDMGGIVDRAAECWEPLFAVADAAGGDWPQRVRAAANHLVAGAVDDSLTEGVELLAHIREALGSEDKMWTDILLQRLNNRSESPWAEKRGGKGLNDRGLAALLKQHGIKSRTLRIGDHTQKGYRVGDFADAWKRYLSAPLGPLRNKGNSRHIFDNENNNVTDVTDVTQGRGQSDAFEERAAILEYDAGLPRQEAEHQARAEIDDLEIPAFLDRRKNPIRSATKGD